MIAKWNVCFKNVYALTETTLALMISLWWLLLVEEMDIFFKGEQKGLNCLLKK